MILARGWSIFEVGCSPLTPASHEGEMNRVLVAFHPRSSTPIHFGLFPVCCAITATKQFWNVGSVIIGSFLLMPVWLIACWTLVRIVFGCCLSSLEIKNGAELRWTPKTGPQV